MKRVLTALAFLGACTPQDAPPQAPAEAARQPGLLDAEIPAPAGEIRLTGVTSQTRVTSPLTIEGLVKADWVFEGQFPTWIEVDGMKVAEAPARHVLPEDGSYPDPLSFNAELVFDVTRETPGTLVLQEDMPQPVAPGTDEAGPARTLRIPILLAPPAQ